MSITSEISRRQFIGGVAAFGSSSLFMPALCSESRDEPLIRFGVASDVHILADWRDANCRDLDRQPEYLEKALRWFDSQRADAVVFSGDMAHTGRVAELERLAAVWDRVFPGGRAADGRNVEHLLVTGNHEIGQWPGLWDGYDDATLKKIRFDYDREHIKATWKRLFHEDYELMWKRTVKGVVFIGCQHPRKGIQEPDISRGIAELAADAPKDQPFFYIQHPHPAHSCYGGMGGAVDEEDSNIALSRFPNAVALSGHSHNSLCDERSVWQGAYTSIGCGSVAEATPGYRDFSYENGCPPYSPAYARQRMKCIPQIGNDGRCCLFFEVYKDHLVVRRWSLAFDEPLGSDWVIPVPARSDGEFSFERRKAEWRPPQFPVGARLTAEVCTGTPALAGPGLVGKPCVRLVFPHAGPSGCSRVFDYVVKAFAEGREIKRFYVLDLEYNLPENRVTANGECLIGLHELPTGKRISFTVEPRNCYGTTGHLLRCEWTA